jgi:hypothetical protein
MDIQGDAPRVPAVAAAFASNGAKSPRAGAHEPAGEGANAPVSAKSEATALQFRSANTNGNGGQAAAVASAADR